MPELETSGDEVATSRKGVICALAALGVVDVFAGAFLVAGGPSSASLGRSRSRHSYGVSCRLRSTRVMSRC